VLHICVLLVAYPFRMLSIRVAVTFVAGAGGPLTCVMATWQAGGLLGLYRGVGVSLVRALANEAASEALRPLAFKLHRLTSDAENQGDIK
jgi:hypothetical protein